MRRIIKQSVPWLLALTLLATPAGAGKQQKIRRLKARVATLEAAVAELGFDVRAVRREVDDRTQRLNVLGVYGGPVTNEQVVSGDDECADDAPAVWQDPDATPGGGTVLEC